jgi:antitoxin VapB
MLKHMLNLNSLRQKAHMTTSTHITSETIAPYAVDTAARAVKLFRNGANQAVRIPKEFELPGLDALIHREGDRLIIELAKPKYEKGSAAALLAVLNTMEPIDEEFPDVGEEGLLPLDDIDFGDEAP